MASIFLMSSALFVSPFHRTFTSPRFLPFLRNSAAALRRQKSSNSRIYSTFPDGFLGKQENNASDFEEGKSYLLFLGTGTSEGIPRVSCLTHPEKRCQVCWSATQSGNKNRRRNTSVVIRSPTPNGIRNILIDAGKFFYHSALEWFPYYGIRELDAVILTHSHADAIGGLDDLRDWTNNIQDVVPIYVAQRDYDVMRKTHYYLIDTSVVTPGAAVSKLQFHIIEEHPFVVQGLEV